MEAFKEAFGGEPYFEHYSDDEVIDGVWLPHIKDGIVVLAWDEDRCDKVVGFGCALPLSKSPADVQEFLLSREADGELPKEFSPQKAWYMSELGVLTDYRLRGTAYELVRHRIISLEHAGASQYFMRTADERSNSRHLYERIGGKELSKKQDLSSSEQVLVNGSKSTKRIYLWGGCKDANREISRIQRERGYVTYDGPTEDLSSAS